MKVHTSDGSQNKKDNLLFKPNITSKGPEHHILNYRILKIQYATNLKDLKHTPIK